MIFADPYWSVAERMDLLSKWIIVHSILYYELDVSIIADKMFDSNSKQLLVLLQRCSSQVHKMRWGYVMKDFDGATGFDLYNKLNKQDKKDLLQVAKHLKHLEDMSQLK